MEDAATAEISRSQLWQWRVHAATLDDGGPMTAERYTAIRDDELGPAAVIRPGFRWTDASALLDELVLRRLRRLPDVPAYPAWVDPPPADPLVHGVVGVQVRGRTAAAGSHRSCRPGSRAGRGW